MAQSSDLSWEDEIMTVFPLQAPEDLRRSVFYEALRCSSSDMEKIPDQLKLPLCVTRFWFQYRQQNRPDGLTLSCLQALVLGFVFGETDGGEFQLLMSSAERTNISSCCLCFRLSV